MGNKRVSLAEAMAAPPVFDRAKIEATTEVDIQRQMVEDGEDPDAPVRAQDWTPAPETIRARLRMTQAAFAAAIRVPVATVRNWEQHRVKPDPAARALLVILDREPEAALRALSPA